MLSSAVYSLGVETAGPPGGPVLQAGGKAGPGAGRRREGAWSRHHLHTGAPRDRVLLNGVEAQDYSQNPGAQG